MPKPEESYSKVMFDETAEFDNNVVDSPDWIDIKQVAQLLGIGDRQVRNKCKELNWAKKYAKINGRPYLYLQKKTIVEYRDINGPTPNVEEAQISQNTPEIKPIPETTGKVAENNPEVSMKENKLVSYEMVTAIDIIRKELSSRNDEVLAMHKQAVEKATVLQDKNTKIEKEVTFWRTSTFWLGGSAIVVILSLGAFLYFTSTNLGGIMKERESLSNNLNSLQKDLYDTKLDLSKKQSELDEAKAADEAKASMDKNNPLKSKT